jgi:hypothetical protein
MIEQQPQEIDTAVPRRRRGNAFDTLSNVLRDVKELNFRNDLLMRNRPSSIATSKNVFEMYVNKDPEDGENYFYFGRNGVSTETQTRNVNYIELTANADTTKTEKRAQNGQVRLGLSVDKQESDGVIQLVHAGTVGDNKTGVLAIINGVGDGSSNDLGRVQLSYIREGGVDVNIILDKDGIQMYGLPSEATGLSAVAIWNDSGTLKIVT